MRRVLLATALLVAVSCGGSPVSPQIPATVPIQRPVVLASGPYTLALAMAAAGIPVCQNGICTSVSLCISTGNSTRATTPLAVDLERSGDTATVRVPGTTSPLVLTLLVASSSVTGTITGSARDASGLLIDVSGSVSGGAPPSNAAIAVSGNIDGQMSVSGDGCSNNGHTWSLSPR